jgi:DNA helicase-2/ATP-dependent DNA helicase PcrA
MQTLNERYLAAKRGLFDRYYASLNSAQREAVYHILNPLLILAGAGSGKTTVLVRRIAYIIRFGNAYHSNYVPATVTEAEVQSLEAALRAPLQEKELEELLCSFAVFIWLRMTRIVTDAATRPMTSAMGKGFTDVPTWSS